MVGTTTAMLIAAGVKAGTDVAGSAINSRAQGKAADKQAEAIEKGIELQREMYQQDRADMAPYRGLGAGAVGNLAYLGGINLPEQASPTAQAATAQAPKLSLSTLGKDPGSMGASTLQRSLDKVNGVMERMNAGEFGPTIKVTKNGQTRVIPSKLLPQAMQQGYQQVQG